MTINTNWIDPHIHLFALGLGEYGWLRCENPPYWPDKALIAKEFTETQLNVASQGRLQGFVHIEAGFDNQRPWREVHFLTTHCKRPFRSVACIDLNACEAHSHIDTLATYSSVSGLRHILDEDAAGLLNTPKVRWSLAHMASHNLSFEAQLDVTDSKAVKALLHALERTPNLRIAINHTAIAPLALSSYRFMMWKEHIRRLSETKQVMFKFSGLEMQDRQWSWQRAYTLFDSLLSITSSQQVMLASNYPLSLWRMPYIKLWGGYSKMVSMLSACEQEALLKRNAYKWYGF